MSIRPPSGSGTSGGYTPGGTDVAVADGGTGASTAADARTNLGAVGTDGPYLKDFARSVRTSGNITLNSGGASTWANLDTGLDLVLTAAAGDLIEVGLSGFFNDEAVFPNIDVATVVGGSPVNYFGGGTAVGSGGIPSWRAKSSQYGVTGAPRHRILEAGDISGGTVTLRLRYASSANKTLRATTGDPLEFTAKNFGPV